MRVLSIQPARFTNGSLPYPFIINPDHTPDSAEGGNVLDQDFWRGDPYHLIGFQAQRDVQTVDLYAHDFFTEPQRAVGMYPVFVEAGAGIYTYTLPITSVTELTIPDQED
jgi:hypothetical protein